jgi:hypothetical protein
VSRSRKREGGSEWHKEQVDGPTTCHAGRAGAQPYHAITRAIYARPRAITIGVKIAAAVTAPCGLPLGVKSQYSMFVGTSGAML